MGSLKVGDIVARKSYGCDIFFKVVDIKKSGNENIITLKGICYRIEADAPESDLILQSDQMISEHTSRLNRAVDKKYRDIQTSSQSRGPKKSYTRDTSKDTAKGFARPGKVLHIDGDSEYLNNCINEYKKFGIDVVGKYIPEKDQSSSVYRLLQDYKPDILVLTGHDGVLKTAGDYMNLDNYKNSKYYIDSVKEARRYQRDYDGLVIFAGACQSLYKEIILAGANFASSPYRVLIHALDPVFICQKIAFTGVDKILEPSDVINNTMTGSKGIGGVQTRGKYRNGFPAEPYEK